MLHAFLTWCLLPMGFPGSASGKEPAAIVGDTWDKHSILGVGKDPQRQAWQSTPVFLPGESPGQRSRLQFIGSQRVGYDWSDLVCMHYYPYSKPPCYFFFFYHFVIDIEWQQFPFQWSNKSKKGTIISWA